MAVRRIGNINIGYTVPQAQTQIYNAIGRTAGEEAAAIANAQVPQTTGDDNFFVKRGKSIENALGTTGSALVGGGIELGFNVGRDIKRGDFKTRMNNIAKKYGYDSWSDWQDGYQAAKDAGDTAKVAQMSKQLKEFQAQANANSQEMNNIASNYKEYKDNSYIGKKVNQDNTKFAGSAINTLSTATDIALPGAGIALNAAQGAAEGLADELEQNGGNVDILHGLRTGDYGVKNWDNFSGERAAQNALIGATTGAVTGALNKGISNVLAKRGGNLFKGGNALTRGLNNLGSKTAVGRVGSTLATGAARGALSGAVGGATGAGLSAAMNGGDVFESAIQGAQQGARQGAVAGGVMAGANMALSRTPGIGNFMQDLNQASEDWRNSGSNFDERLTNTLTSGDSAVGDWLMNRRQSKVLGSVGSIGNSVRNVSGDLEGAVARMEDAVQNEDFYFTKANNTNSRKTLNAVQEAMGILEDAGDTNTSAYKRLANIYKNRELNTNGDIASALLEIDNSLGYYADKSNPRYNEIVNAIASNREAMNSLAATTPTPTTAGADGNIERAAITYSNETDGRIDPSELTDFYEQTRNVPNTDVQGMAEAYEIETDGRVNADELLDFVRQQDGATILTGTPNASDTPTTAKGWLKKAGERIVEDANDRGVGLGIKDVANTPDYEQMFYETSDLTDAAKNRIAKRLIEIEPNQTLSNRQATVDNVYSLLDKAENMADVKNILKQNYGAWFTDSQINDLTGANGFINDMRNSQYSDDVRNMGINQWENDPNYITEAEVVNEAPIQTRAAQTPQLDAWDRLAQENGYQNYNEVIQRYMEANPGVQLNPNGAAGQILTWLDQNPNTPTTASGWAKLAGQRAVEDINQRGVGLSLQDVSEDNPQTRVYNSLTEQQQSRLPEVFEPEARNQIESRNKLQSLGEQLDAASRQQKYAGLYGSLDAGTASRAIQTNAPETLSRLGITPENYLEAAKTSNYVNQVVSDLAKKSNVKVIVPDMAERLAAATDDVVFATTDAPNKFNRAVRQIVADGTTPDEYSAGYLIEASRDFGNKAAKIKNTSPDAKALREAYTNAKYILRDEADAALAKANVTGAETNQRIADGLAKMGANQDVIDYYTEAVNGEAPTARDYIRRTSLFEQARDMGTQMSAEKLTRSASKAPTRVSTKILRASGLEQPMEILLQNTVAPAASLLTKGAGKLLSSVGGLASKITGNGTTTTPTTAVDTSVNPTTRIYNAIGRTEGLTNAEQANTAQYLANAVQDARAGYVQPLGATTSTYNADSLEDLITPNTVVDSTAMDTTGTTTSATTPTAASTSVYDSLYGTPTQTSSSVNTGYFDPTGDYWTDILAAAMSSAIDDNDVTAFASLYGMYQDALSKLQSEAAAATTSTTSATKLTDKQRQANAAARALEDFEQAEHNFAYDVSDIPVVGNIATFGGNDYASKAEALALQVGYMLSGATVNKEEAKKIGEAYVPQPRDNAVTRQNKLNQLRGIISDYQQTYAE